MGTGSSGGGAVMSPLLEEAGRDMSFRMSFVSMRALLFVDTGKPDEIDVYIDLVTEHLEQYLDWKMGIIWTEHDYQIGRWSQHISAISMETPTSGAVKPQQTASG